MEDISSCPLLNLVFSLQVASIIEFDVIGSMNILFFYGIRHETSIISCCVWKILTCEKAYFREIIIECFRNLGLVGIFFILNVKKIRKFRTIFLFSNLFIQNHPCFLHVCFVFFKNGTVILRFCFPFHFIKNLIIYFIFVYIVVCGLFQFCFMEFIYFLMMLEFPW